MLRLNCFIKVNSEKREEVLAAAKRLTKASLKQDGCISYDIFESATRNDVLMICETWLDKETLDAHSVSEVFKEEVGKMRSMAEMKLEIFNKYSPT
ncbi:MAG: antibiotic biosynthesis monooxygenase [Prevotella sp.]|nr:antibiotic biosynthesis monooxygenase [Bacteroides sp.]MCM1367113.1 antibiotic biosynthesis monooxygenase [Prevotella sp.]MCM1437425.1 antibiotic biosynthesis monooxygenase [Prevotella sp.]